MSSNDDSNGASDGLRIPTSEGAVVDNGPHVHWRTGLWAVMCVGYGVGAGAAIATVTDTPAALPVLVAATAIAAAAVWRWSR